MKKLNYIIAFVMVGLIGFQPIKQVAMNHFAEQNRLEREAFINSIVGEKINYKKVDKCNLKNKFLDEINFILDIKYLILLLLIFLLEQFNNIIIPFLVAITGLLFSRKQTWPGTA